MNQAIRLTMLAGIAAHLVGCTNDPDEQMSVSDESGCIYSGAMQNNLPHGNGTQVCMTEVEAVVKGCFGTYEGYFRRGLRHGQGTCRDVLGHRYVGSWVDGAREGQGVFYSAQGKILYEGQWKANMLDSGQLTEYMQNGDINRQCSVVNGAEAGTCTVFWGKDVIRYQGEMKSGKMHGYGREQDLKGHVYSGNFLYGRRHGEGIEEWPDGQRYEGNFSDGKYHGFGVRVYAEGWKYEGNWSHGKEHGDGTLYRPDGGIEYRGRYVNGVQAGE